MEDSAKSLQKKLSEWKVALLHYTQAICSLSYCFCLALETGGNKKTKNCGTFKGLDKQMRDFLSTTPLISGWIFQIDLESPEPLHTISLSQLCAISRCARATGRF